MKRVALLLGLVLLGGCAAARPVSTPARDLGAIEAALARHIAVLAGDDFEGRRPGTEGEAKTLRYLAREWQAAGLESGTNDPANPWFAPVELSLSIPDTWEARFVRGKKAVEIPEDSLTLYASGRRALVEGAPVVFVGEAGERLDRAELAGRVAVMLWDHEGRAEQREALFDKGAAAVIAVVESDEEFAQLAETRRRGIYRLKSEDDGSLLDGIVTAEAAAKLFGPAHDFAELARAAREPGFLPAPLNLTATLEAASTPGLVRTHNLIARLPGRRPETGAVLLLAHWDHFGHCVDPPAPDTICNGAVDNASGLAMLTELARRLATGPRMDRDVYFLATTAEEWGLLGARAFAQDPPLPLDLIVAALNLDTVAVAPRGSPVAIVGGGLTSLDPVIAETVSAAGRELGGEAVARQFVRRQDSWALLQRDVPAVAVSSAFAEAAPLERYLATRYHKPSDEAEAVELGGAAEDLLLHLALVRRFADASRFPGASAEAAPAP